MTGLSVLAEYFKNYEETKLYISNPGLLNSLIYLTLFFAILITLRKKPSTLLDFSQTEQLKGLAMIFVVVGHFWQHVCNEHGSFLVFGDYSVTLFLLLSGYGHMKSNMVHPIRVGEFLKKKVRKIFISYWLVTFGIIIADYVLLQKQYHWHEILLTFVGINLSNNLQYFDHARWFITLLLMNYFVFLICAKLWKPSHATLALLFFSIVLIILRRYELFPQGTRAQLLAFPLGCLLAVIGVVKWWSATSIRYQIVLTLFVGLAMLSIFLISKIDRVTVAFYEVRSVIYLQSYVLPFLFCLLCIVSISLVATTGYTSRFLNLFGFLSYELYLIHCSILIKYNPILGQFENGYILIGIILWLGVALGLAFALKTCSSQLLNATMFVNRMRFI